MSTPLQATIQASEPFDVLAFLPNERTQRLFVAQRHQEFLNTVSAAHPQITELYVQMHNMRDSEGYTVRYGVTVVPTWILLRDAKELGRIVREPAGAFAEDIARILGGRL